jgi:hypothetical protein
VGGCVGVGVGGHLFIYFVILYLLSL